MPLITASGERLPLEITWNGVKSCPEFLAIEGLSLGQCGHLSSCNCAFHRMLRTDEESEDPDNEVSLPTQKTP